MSCFYAWTLKNGHFCSCFGAPELDFTVFLRVFCASIGLDLRFIRKFTWNRIALMARNPNFAVFLCVFCASIGLDLRFTRKFTWNRIALMARNHDFAVFFTCFLRFDWLRFAIYS